MLRSRTIHSGLILFGYGECSGVGLLFGINRVRMSEMSRAGLAFGINRVRMSEMSRAGLVSNKVCIIIFIIIIIIGKYTLLSFYGETCNRHL